MSFHLFPGRAAGLVLMPVLLAGCVSLPQDRGAQAVRELAEARAPGSGLRFTSASEQEIAARVDGLLAQEIDAQSAVRLALLDSPRLRMLYAELGLSFADVYDATRLANPRLGFLALASDAAAGGTQVTWSLAQNFMELLFQSYRARLGRAAQVEGEQRIAQAVLDLETEVREAYYRHAAARLALQMRRTVAQAVDLSTRLATRFHEAGNISVLQLGREQAAASDAAIGELRAAASEAAARGQLLTLLGLETDDPRPRFADDLRVPALVDLDTAAAIAMARANRLDLAALQTRAWSREEQLRHARRWRWLGGLTALGERERELDGEVLKGGGASVDLPLFNPGTGVLQRAQSRAELANAQVEAAGIALGNEIAAQLAALEAAHAVAEEYRLRLIPARERIVDASQREQNFMLIGAFELLAARREELDAYEDYISAIRDYWIERARLARLTGGALPAQETERLSLPGITPSSEHEHAEHGGAQ